MRVPTDHELHASLRDLFGFSAFRPGQHAVIERVLAGESVLAVMPTGAGKSLCYQFPAALLPGCTLVISPLIALMKDQVDALPPSLAHVATVINSEVEGSEMERRLRAIAAGQIRLVYAAPERLRNLPFLHFVSQARPSLLVIDEAHCVDQWGHDFRPDYAAIHTAIPALGAPTVLALTATATPATADSIENALGLPLRRMMFGICRPNLRLEVIHCAEEAGRREALSRRCRAETGRGLLYVPTRRIAEELTARLRQDGVEAAHYHAGMESEPRAEAHTRFQDGSLRVLVATVAFGMGIDIPDVRFLLHHSPPDSLQSYTQEAGRAGRDGLPACCTLYTTPDDVARLRRRMERDAPTLDTIRRVYEAVKQLLPGRWGLAAMDDLRRETGLEATPIRVALAYLERVGLVRRHADTPLTIDLRRVKRVDSPTGPPELLHLLSAFCPADGSWHDVPIENVCDTLGLAVHEVEPALLSWQQENWIVVRGGMREPTLERPHPPDGAKAALERELARYAAERESRVQTLLDYVATAMCRHHYLAAYFAQESPTSCQACDNCRPNGKQRKESPEAQSDPIRTDIAVTILRCMAALPYALGRSGIVRLLQGTPDSPLPATRSAYHGALQHLTTDTLHEALDSLLAEGLLRCRQEGNYPVFALTPLGARSARAAKP